MRIQCSSNQTWMNVHCHSLEIHILCQMFKLLNSNMILLRLMANLKLLMFQLNWRMMRMMKITI
ncbi:hypothetical protein RGQ29_017300 [Quercus rubra]|uniref:Uncharacterized protein n=1 Tax=Quercus rubra TaxID=3512 RepID=A0AAN7FN31_QUERU|nr:hypothetical protein RGQ29_017300 [Quercus rubra]